MSTPLRRFGDRRADCAECESLEGWLAPSRAAVMEDTTHTAHGTRDTLMNEEPTYVIAMVYPSTSDLWFYTAVLLVFMWTSVRLWRRVRS